MDTVNTEATTHRGVVELSPIVKDALCGVGHEWQVVGPVHHLSVVIVEGSNLEKEVISEEGGSEETYQ